MCRARSPLGYVCSAALQVEERASGGERPSHVVFRNLERMTGIYMLQGKLIR